MLVNQQQDSNIRNYIEKFFLIFILLQPLLDLTAYFGLPISNPFRVLALFVGFVYLLLHTNKKIKWIGTGYFVLLGLFMVGNFIMNYFLKDPFFISEELTYNVKSLYVVGMLIVYIAVFDSIRKWNNWENIVVRNFALNMILISIVMFLAHLTNSGKRSYGMLVKEGHSGWFFSANELSAILAMGFGFLIIYYTKKEDLKNKLIILPFIFLSAWSMLTIGTKVGLGSLLLVLVLSVLLSLWELVRRKRQLVNFITLTITLVLTVLYIPVSAVGNNLDITLFPSDPRQVEPPSIVNEEVDDEEELEIGKPKIEEITKNALSGRDEFLEEVRSDYGEAPMSQKLIGMGQGGNYEEKLVLVEMDFHDWFYGYGLIGFILLIIPIVYFSLMTIIRLIKNKLKQLTPSYFILGISFCLGIGTALVAGHVLLNPASGIYLSILLSYLFIKASKSIDVSKQY